MKENEIIKKEPHTQTQNKHVTLTMNPKNCVNINESEQSYGCTIEEIASKHENGQAVNISNNIELTAYIHVNNIATTSLTSVSSTILNTVSLSSTTINHVMMAAINQVEICTSNKEISSTTTHILQSTTMLIKPIPIKLVSTCQLQILLGNISSGDKSYHQNTRLSLTNPLLNSTSQKLPSIATSCTSDGAKTTAIVPNTPRVNRIPAYPTAPRKPRPAHIGVSISQCSRRLIFDNPKRKPEYHEYIPSKKPRRESVALKQITTNIEPISSLSNVPIGMDTELSSSSL
jgi:hypothetical protein